MSIISKSLDKLAYSEVNANGELSNNQVECAKTVIRAFDSEYPKTNYVLVKGQAQAGKTGVLFAMVNIINRLRLKETLNINTIIYITADNSKGLVSQQYSRSSRSLVEFSDDDMKIVFLKRSDFKNYKSKVGSIDNSIIFIDESHFGTSKEENLLPQFLFHYGIDYLKNTNLEEHNIRIISNTATPYAELESDKVESKITVFLEPADGYIGILDFAGNVVSMSKNAFDRRVACSTLPKLFSDVYDYLKEIEAQSGKTKCAIFRACGRRDLSNIYKYGGDKFDIYEFDTSKGSALDYDNLWNKIDLYCMTGRGRTDGKYLMVVIKDAMRMGISIREKDDHNSTKNRIAVLYDYPSDKYKPDVTEQGLLGRMCGYRDHGDEEWKDIRFYLNEGHFTSLKNFYENGMFCENGRLKTLKLAKKKLEKERIENITGMVSSYDAEKNGLDADTLDKEGKLYHVDVMDTNDFYYEYDATEYFASKVGTNFGGFENFQLSHLKQKDYQFFKKFILPFLVSKDEHYASEKYVHKGSRRCGVGVGENQTSWINNLKDGKQRIIVTDSAYPFKTEDNGKFAWQSLLDMDDMENPISPKIYIRVKVAKMAAFKYNQKVMEECGVRTAETMITG